eukprot:UN27963
MKLKYFGILSLYIQCILWVNIPVNVGKNFTHEGSSESSPIFAKTAFKTES